MKIFCLAALVSTSTAVNNIPTSGYVGCISGMNTAYITSEWKYGGGNDATPWTIAGYDELNYPSGFTCENGAGAPCTYPSDSSLSSKYMDYWNQCRDNCQSEGNGYEFFSLACGKECRCFNAAALPQSKNDVGTGFDSSGSPNWGYGKANNKWYPMNQCSSKWNNDWCGRPAAFEFGGRTYLNGGSGRAAIYCANPDGCTAPDSYVPSNTPNPTTTTTTTTTTATGTTTTTSTGTASTTPTYTHGAVASGGNSFGSSNCPVECKSDGKTIQVFHSTNHGTGLDDTSVHSPSNVMPHSCMHNKDTNKCECTCTSAQDATATTTTTPPAVDLAAATQYKVTTIAGGKENGWVTPNGIKVQDGVAFVSDQTCIRRVVTATGAETTLAGYTLQPGESMDGQNMPNVKGQTDGTSQAARFNSPSGLDIKDGIIYVSSYGNNNIRRIDVASGAVTTVAGGPEQVVRDNGNVQWTANMGTSNGVGDQARFRQPQGVALEAGTAYVTDTTNHLIRRIDRDTKTVTTLAGTYYGHNQCPEANKVGNGGCHKDGTGAEAIFHRPWRPALHNGFLYVSDYGNSVIRRVELATNTVTTIAGKPGEKGSADGVGDAARFNAPGGIVITNGVAFVTDFTDGTIRKIDLTTFAVTTIAGEAGTLGSSDGVGGDARFKYPIDLALDGDALVVADWGCSCLRRIEAL